MGALPDVSGEIKISDGPWLRPEIRSAKKMGLTLLPADRQSQSGVMPFSGHREHDADDAKEIPKVVEGLPCDGKPGDHAVGGES